ncbi:hypothetical protein BC829DRAFT_389064 [Chytridium lagenaria]|nr:hypothetical protein BC829DRAFT_389064 [Chytridium lagenaria]
MKKGVIRAALVFSLVGYVSGTRSLLCLIHIFSFRRATHTILVFIITTIITIAPIIIFLFS